MNRLAPGVSPDTVIGKQMGDDKAKVLHYKRSRFTTQLPVGHLYSPSHFWAARHEDDLWRVGLTKFATRMLGDMVEFAIEIESDKPVASGQIIGWVEGFKAISDIFCIADGNFAGANQELKSKIALINKAPYGAGWIYAVRGQPDAKCLDVHAYIAVLDKTIDKILQRQNAETVE